MELIKKIDRTKKFVGKDGKEHASVRYLIRTATADGKVISIAIQPAFKSDYMKMDLLCEVETIG